MDEQDFKKMEDLLKRNLEESEKRIITEMGNFVHNQIIPTIEEKADKSDIERLERRLDAQAIKDSQQDNRLQRIETLPAIAHQIKPKK